MHPVWNTKRRLEKISRKDASIHSHSLTGFPVEGENPLPGEKNSDNSSGDCFASRIFQKKIPLLPFTQDFLIWKRSPLSSKASWNLQNPNRSICFSVLNVEK